MSASGLMEFEAARSPSLAKWFASAVIVTILGAQAVVSFMPAMNHFFPIINYPMFSGTHRDGDRLDDYFVHAVFPDGTETLITPEDVGMDFWTFRANVVTEIIKADDIRKVSALASEVCGGRGVDEVTLRVTDIGMVITRNGAVQQDPMLVNALTFPCAN